MECCSLVVNLTFSASLRGTLLAAAVVVADIFVVVNVAAVFVVSDVVDAKVSLVVVIAVATPLSTHAFAAQSRLCLRP